MSSEPAQKSKSYMKRLRLPFRRRREGKTDYRQRHALIRHDKRNYGEVKSRFVARITNTKVICQIVKAYGVGDKVVSSADSTELKKYGITFGLKNYSAAYATGFLCARKLLHKLDLAETYEGKEDLDGEEYLEEDNEEGPKAYRCFLDIGLARSSKGAKVFAAMKGACDGGLHIPHSAGKFVGYSKEEKELDSDELRRYIYGGHVADYMSLLKEEDEEKYARQFSEYIAQGIEPGMLEERYEKAFELIREDAFEAKEKAKGDYSKYKRAEKKLTGEERRRRAEEKYKVLSGEVEMELA